ncbi:KR domain-containing protein [Streptomyces zhihengii]
MCRGHGRRSRRSTRSSCRTRALGTCAGGTTSGRRSSPPRTTRARRSRSRPARSASRCAPQGSARGTRRSWGSRGSPRTSAAASPRCARVTGSWAARTARSAIGSASTAPPSSPCPRPSPSHRRPPLRPPRDAAGGRRSVRPRDTAGRRRSSPPDQRQDTTDPSPPETRHDKGTFTAFDVRDAPHALRHARQNAAHPTVLTLPRALDPDGTVLITGGLGELGSALAAHLVRARSAAARAAVAARRQRPDAGSSVRDLEAAGAERVDLVAGDVADRAAVAAALEGIDPGHPHGRVPPRRRARRRPGGGLHPGGCTG